VGAGWVGDAVGDGSVAAAQNSQTSTWRVTGHTSEMLAALPFGLPLVAPRGRGRVHRIRIVKSVMLYRQAPSSVLRSIEAGRQNESRTDSLLV
jgi:hypothetical protein